MRSKDAPASTMATAVAAPMTATMGLAPDDVRAPMAFLADRDAFQRRFLLSLVLQPPLSRRRRVR